MGGQVMWMDGFAGTTKLFRHVCRERRLAKRQRNFFPVVLSRTLTVSEPKYAALPLLSSCTSVTIDANSSQVSFITAPATRVPFARPRTTYSTCPLSPKTRRYGFLPSLLRNSFATLYLLCIFVVICFVITLAITFLSFHS